LNQALDELKKTLSRQTPADFTRLDARQQESLLDFAHSEGPAAVPEAFLAAVLANDWPKITREHSYVRYAGHAPDHPRNKAFAERWIYPQLRAGEAKR
jgi:hypothetical protein